MTVHGSHNVTVVENVAYDHVGHCYFLEDGGERNTHFIKNLGLGTRKGILTPSDDQPTTFWMTSAHSTMIGNAAAGSSYKEGVGIWFIIPDIITGPSRPLNFFQRKEQKYYPITEFRDNVVHSNGGFGLAIFRRLGLNHEILGCSTYSPKVDPLDKKSNYQPVILDNLIGKSTEISFFSFFTLYFLGFKNRMVNAILRTAAAEMVNCKFADSKRSIEVFKNFLDGYQKIKDTVIVGESPNVGKKN